VDDVKDWRNAYRYGAYDDGPDPLAPPYDVAEALDQLGDEVLNGSSAREALQELLRRGADGLRGLDELARQTRRRMREARDRGRLDGTLEEVRQLLDEALQQERTALFPDPSDDARFREQQLDSLPRSTAQAVQELRPYDWRSPEARQTYEQIGDLLKREVLDQQFRGMKQALESPDPEAMQRVKDMLADLNAMLASDARGEDTTEQFEQFMDKHGDFFPDQPQNLQELLDSLARRAAAAERLMNSLTREQRQELGELMDQAMSDLDLAAQMAQLSDALRAARPDAFGQQRAHMSGEESLGLGEGTSALEELADLEALEGQLAQDYYGASLDDVDEDAVRRALGRRAVDDLEQLRRLERELEAQGYLARRDGELELTAKAVRRLGRTALRRVFADLEAGLRGAHDLHEAGAAGDITGATRAWQFGDEQPLDVVRTVSNALLRRGIGSPVRLHVDDFEVRETERRTSAAVCLLVDLSYSMVLNGTWGPAKQTALALHTLVTTAYPQDALQVVGFSNYARELQPAELAGLDWDMVQGTNLQHALLVAGRFLDKHAEADPVVLVVTDGEPTAHLSRDGRSIFDWPPAPETLELTLAEVDKMTRRGATLNIFMLGDEPRLQRFVETVAKRNGGRVFNPDSARLGDFVVSDFLRARRAMGSRRRAG
jgi:uncharacterized protein with von Willebrand factor type A (vWA) domain